MRRDVGPLHTTMGSIFSLPKETFPRSETSSLWRSQRLFDQPDLASTPLLYPTPSVRIKKRSYRQMAASHHLFLLICCFYCYCFWRFSNNISPRQGKKNSGTCGERRSCSMVCLSFAMMQPPTRHAQQTATVAMVDLAKPLFLTCVGTRTYVIRHIFIEILYGVNKKNVACLTISFKIHSTDTTFDVSLTFVAKE